MFLICSTRCWHAPVRNGKDRDTTNSPIASVPQTLREERTMDRNQILEAIDEEIGRLERVRALLNSTNGRGAFTGISAKTNGNGIHAVKKRILSEDARNRIAQAQKRRWAKQHKEMAAAKRA